MFRSIEFYTPFGDPKYLAVVHDMVVLDPICIILAVPIAARVARPIEQLDLER